MELVMIVVIGVLSSVGTYLLLQRSLLQLIMGLAIISQAANMVIFVSGGLVADRAAFIESDAKVLGVGTADSLPQALILTAIVIGFAMLAYFIVLVQKVYSTRQTDQVDQLTESDR